MLLHMQALCPQLISIEQRQQLAADVDKLVATFSLDELQPYRSSSSLLSGIFGLGLQVSQATVATLSQVALNMPLPAQQVAGAKGVAFSLLSLNNMGCTFSQVEASRWEDMLLTAWRADQKRSGVRLDVFDLMLQGLLALPALDPCVELQQLLLAVAAGHAARVDRRTAERIRQAASAWGVTLPPEVVQLLLQREARGGRTAAAGGRARRGGRPGASRGRGR